MFPFKKDNKLLLEAKELRENTLYENEAVFMFGFQLGKVYNELQLELLHLVFRSPQSYPDAILFREDTEEVLNIEFEAQSRNFEVHGHDPNLCDLIVCHYHDENWKNPVHVYELWSGKMYSPHNT